MEEMKKEQIPQIGSRLRQHILKIPEAVFQASGIIINGRRIKSFVFTTDLAIIRNCDADAVFAVYPFTPQQAISDAIIRSSYIPVFCGVGGGTTKGIRTVSLAKDVESQGANRIRPLWSAARSPRTYRPAAEHRVFRSPIRRPGSCSPYRFEAIHTRRR